MTLTAFQLDANSPEKIKGLYAPDNLYQNVLDDLAFWKNRDQSNSTMVSQNKLAQIHLKLFAIDANLEHLLKAEKLLNSVIDNYTISSASVYRSLASIKMKQHRFCDALEDLQMAEAMGDDLFLTENMYFDVYFELEQDEQVLYYMDKIKQRGGFEYLIRKARFEDGIGNLAQAITDLENSRQFISDNDWTKQAWLYSNLADFYGHAGEIEKSRSYFLNALTLNPADWYSVKGLAWINYAHDNNPEASLNLLNIIQRDFYIPSVESVAYKIYKSNGNIERAKDIQDQFVSQMTGPEYLSSYAHYIYNMDLNSIDTELLQQTVSLELSQRPSADSYSRLAQLYNHNGDREEARKIVDQYVIGKTLEPAPLSKSLEIIETTHPQFKAVQEIVLDAKFELGPQ